MLGLEMNVMFLGWITEPEKSLILKNSEVLAKQGISLPIDPNLKKNEIKKIIEVINNL